ncbi:MAG: hypothetical protein LBP61_01710 [Desulfovibrio sp.]|jgi:hypothetical protein|nr:hypothetical protein [Desulfovibrio sp.]
MAASAKVKGGKAWKKTLSLYVAGADAELRVGILEGATYSGEAGKAGLPVAVVGAAHEFGTKDIPARSFLRSTLAKKKEEWIRLMALYLRANPGKIRDAFALLGETAAKDIQAAIEAGLKPALKPATVLRKLKRKGKKGSPDLPLVDTGTLQEAISYEVKP